MFHDNYIIIKNLIFNNLIYSEKKTKTKTKTKIKVNHCLEIKQQLDKCLKKNQHTCIVIKTLYENCIKQI